MYAALAALPWAGAELGAACPAEMSALAEGVEAYLVGGAEEGGKVGGEA